MLDYLIANGIKGFPFGFSSFAFGDGGNLIEWKYDADPYVGYNKNGVFGLWINYYAEKNNGYSEGFGHEVLNEGIICKYP
jgi:hypothetical protein